MRVLMFVFASLFFLLLDGPALLLPTQAYAGCCACGFCQLGCDCPGSAGCWWYRCSRVADDLQLNVSNDASMLSISEPRPIIREQDVTNRLLELTRGGQRVAGNFGLKLLDSVPEGAKVACARQDNVVAFNFALQTQPDPQK